MFPTTEIILIPFNLCPSAGFPLIPPPFLGIVRGPESSQNSPNVGAAERETTDWSPNYLRTWLLASMLTASAKAPAKAKAMATDMATAKAKATATTTAQATATDVATDMATAKAKAMAMAEATSMAQANTMATASGGLVRVPRSSGEMGSPDKSIQILRMISRLDELYRNINGTLSRRMAMPRGKGAYYYFIIIFTLLF